MAYTIRKLAEEPRRRPSLSDPSIKRRVLALLDEAIADAAEIVAGERP